MCQKEVPLLYNQPCNVTSGLPWVNCDGYQNKRTKEYSAKMELQDMGKQVIIVRADICLYTIMVLLSRARALSLSACVYVCVGIYIMFGLSRNMS